MNQKIAYRLCLVLILLAVHSGNVNATLKVGDLSPDYKAKTLTGTPVSLKDLRGKYVLLNVWATWCPPCLEEIPSLESLHKRFGKSGLVVIGSSVDDDASDDLVQDFIKELGVSYTIWRDSNDIFSLAFKVIGVPHTFLIDPQGKILQRWLGPFDGEDPKVIELIREVLAAEPQGDFVKYEEQAGTN